MDDLSAWLAEITLDPPPSTGDLAGPPHLDEDFVVISTVHSAKGLEWSSVHLPHLVDGAFPSDMALGSARWAGRGAEALLRRDHPGPGPAHPVHAAAHAVPPAGPRRSPRPGAGEPVPRGGGARRCSTSKSRTPLAPVAAAASACTLPITVDLDHLWR